MVLMRNIVVRQQLLAGYPGCFTGGYPQPPTPAPMTPTPTQAVPPGTRVFTGYADPLKFSVSSLSSALIDFLAGKGVDIGGASNIVILPQPASVLALLAGSNTLHVTFYFLGGQAVVAAGIITGTTPQIRQLLFGLTSVSSVLTPESGTATTAAPHQRKNVTTPAATDGPGKPHATLPWWYFAAGAGGVVVVAVGAFGAVRLARRRRASRGAVGSYMERLELGDGFLVGHHGSSVNNSYYRDAVF
jgi:hypothetical protein